MTIAGTPEPLAHNNSTEFGSKGFKQIQVTPGNFNPGNNMFQHMLNLGFGTLDTAGTRHGMSIGSTNYIPVNQVAPDGKVVPGSNMFLPGGPIVINALISGQILQFNGTAWVNQNLSGVSVTSVTNSDGTLSISPTIGPVVASINLAHFNTWTDGITVTSSTNGRSISLTANTVTPSSGIAGGSISLTAGNNDANGSAAGTISFTAGNGDDAASGGAITLTAGAASNSGGNINLNTGSALTYGNVVIPNGQVRIGQTSNQFLIGTSPNRSTINIPATGSITLTTPNATTTLAGLAVAETFTALQTFNAGLTVQTVGMTITNVNVALSTTTGTKFGTATNQKLAFFNSTPIIQPLAATDLGTVLSNLGLRVAGTAYPITTSGAISFTAASNQIVLNSGNTTTLTAAPSANRTITFPDGTTTLGGLSLAQTWTGINTYNDYILIQATSEASGKMLWLAKGYDCTSTNRYALYSDNYVNNSGSGILTSGYFQSQTAGSAAQTATVYGINGVAFNNLAGATVSQLTGMNFITYNTGAQQVTLGQGAEVEGRVLGAGNMVTYQGYNSKFSLNTSSGGTTTLTHFNVTAATRPGGSGTITTQYGLFIPDLTSAFVTNAYPIWIDVAGGIYFRATTQKIYSSAANVLDVVAPTLQQTGDFKLTTAGNGYYVKEGSNATMGTGTLSGGTATINTTKVTANSRIFVQDEGGTITNLGALTVASRVNGTSFTVTSTNVLDSSNFVWIIFEPS